MSDEKKIIDKAKDAAAGAREKVSDFVGDHEAQIYEAIDKTGEFVDDKVTRHKFSDKIDRAQDAVKGAVSKLGGRGDAPGAEETAKGQTKQAESPQTETSKAETTKPASKKPGSTKARKGGSTQAKQGGN